MKVEGEPAVDCVDWDEDEDAADEALLAGDRVVGEVEVDVDGSDEGGKPSADSSRDERNHMLFQHPGAVTKSSGGGRCVERVWSGESRKRSATVRRAPCGVRFGASRATLPLRRGCV